MKNHNKIYRTVSLRLQGYDYGQNGAYFITVCTHNRECFFGMVKNHVMELNELGRISEQYWKEITAHFSFIQLGEFIIMPNHIHGILIINKSSEDGLDKCGYAMNRIPTLLSMPKKPFSKQPGGITGNKNPMFHDNISRVMRWYKGRCSFEIRKKHNRFAWQSLFYDHIIRNEQDYNRIAKYIINNPAKWKG